MVSSSSGILEISCKSNMKETLVTYNESEMTNKHPREKRSFRWIDLSNGMKVVLISDQNMGEKCGISLDMQVGSLLDERDYQGVAHLIELSLFDSLVCINDSHLSTGEEIYGDLCHDNDCLRKSFHEYLKIIGGTFVSGTTLSSTNFHIKLKKKNDLTPCLYRLLSIFKKATFTTESIQAHLQIIEATHKKYSKQEIRIKYQKWRSLSRGTSPMNMYSNGSLETLLPDSRSIQALLHQVQTQFMKWYTSSDIMNISISSSYSIESLKQSTIRTLLSPASPSNNNIRYKLTLTNIFDMPYTKEETGRIVRMIGKKDSISIRYFVPLSSIHIVDKEENHHIFTRPLQLISHILGMQSNHSLSHILRKEGLIEDFITVTTYRGCSHIHIELHMKVTSQRAIYPLLSSINHYIHSSLKQNTHLHTEMVAHYMYTYLHISDPSFDMCMYAAEGMEQYSPQTLLLSSYPLVGKNVNYQYW